MLRLKRFGSSRTRTPDGNGIKLNPSCRQCGLCEEARTVCLPGNGPTNAAVMVIGEAPGEEEDREGLPFIGRSGQLLDQTLAAVGIKRREVYVTNTVKCRPPENRKPKAEEVKACTSWLEKEIEHVKPAFIIVLGAIAAKAVLGEKSIDAIRGRAIKTNERTYLPTYHPAYVLRSRRAEPTFVGDFRRFKEIIDGRPAVSVATHIRVISNEDDIIQCIQDLSRSSVVSHDLETSQLKAWRGNANIITCGWGTESFQWVLPIHHHQSKFKDPSEVAKRIYNEVDWSRKVIVGQNHKFDSQWLHFKLGIDFRATFDTMLADYILDENVSHDLESIAARLFGAAPWDIPLAEKQGNAPIARIAKYHGLDLYWTRRIYFEQVKRLKREKNLEKLFYELDMPAATLFVDVEINGCYVNPKKLTDGEKYWREKHATAKVQLDKMFPTTRTYKDKKAKRIVNGYNWNSSPQVAEVLFDRAGLEPLDKTPKGADSTSESVLLRLARHHPAPRLILDLREAEKQLGTFITVWRDERDERSCLHPTFKLHGTVTGRPSCEDPNLYQVPRDPRIRSIIEAPDEWTFVEVDQSQIELRLAAHDADETTMKFIYQTNGDIHTATVQDIIGIENPDKEQRKKGKAINFGFIYGMWWKKFIITARDNYGVDFTEEEAQDIRKGFFRKYSALEDWHKRKKRFAHDHGYVTSIFGRKRRLPLIHEAPMDFRSLTPEQAEAQRQAVNSPIQSSASDLVKCALTQLHKEFDWRGELRTIGHVYDAGLFWVRTRYLGDIVPRIKAVFERPKLLDELDIEISVPLIGDVKVGPWGSGEEIHDMKKFLASLKSPSAGKRLTLIKRI